MLRRLNHDPMTARPPDAQKDNRRAELSFLTPEPYGPTTVSRHAQSVPDTAHLESINVACYDKFIVRGDVNYKV